MSHLRTQIRTWLKANLVGSADAGSRVLIRRALPLEKDLQPTLLISLQNERSVDVSMDGTQERSLEVRVTACAKGDSETTEALLDRLGVFVEERFAGNPTLGGLVETYAYQSTEFSFAGEAEKTLCTAAFTFVLTFYTKRSNPQTSL